jgi:hypothetical protein
MRTRKRRSRLGVNDCSGNPINRRGMAAKRAEEKPEKWESRSVDSHWISPFSSTEIGLSLSARTEAPAGSN